MKARAANALGLLIGAGSGLWIAFHAVHLPKQLTEIAPGPAALLPYLGPVLMVLLLAKVFRPKQTSDYWLLQVIGLMEVALACVLNGDLMLGGLVVLYLGCALWSLMLFYLFRERTAASGGNEQPEAGPSTPGRFLGLAIAAKLLVGAMAVGLVLFLLTPQHGDSRWDTLTLDRGPGAQSSTGFTEEIDLNQTGKLEVSHEVVMEVAATDANNQPKVNLSPDQRLAWAGDG